MKELIRQILREHTEPTLTFKIVLDNSISEQKEHIGKLISPSKKEIELYKNRHSQEFNKNTVSSLNRVDPDDIIESINHIKNSIIKAAHQIVENCNKSDCGSLNVIDNSTTGFDYHMYINKIKGEIHIIINTSIYHPKFLRRDLSSPLIIVDEYGDPYIKNIK
jgi:hypothetical protein